MSQIHAKDANAPRLRSSRGFSLVEVLITAGMLMTVSLAVAYVILAAQRENRSIQEKIEILQLEQHLKALLLNPDTCKCMFDGRVVIGSAISLSPLREGCKTDNLLTSGSPIRGGSAVTVQNVLLEEIISITPPPATTVSGKLRVSFEQDRTVIPRREIEIPGLFFKVTGSVINECSNVPGAEDMCLGLGGDWDTTTSPPHCKLKPIASDVCLIVGGTWSGSTCTIPSLTGPEMCTRLGGVWNTVAARCDIPPVPSAICGAVGGTWNGSSCILPGPTPGPTPPPTQTPQQVCQSLGGTWSSNQCTFSGGGNLSQCVICYQCAAKCWDPDGACGGGSEVCANFNAGYTAFGGFPSPTNQADDQPSVCRVKVTCP